MRSTHPPLKPQPARELPPEFGPASSRQDFTEMMPAWSYQGVTGPESWGRLRDDFSLCGEGKEQSPVDLIWSRPQEGGPFFTPSYQRQPLKMVHVGWTLRLPIEASSSAKIHGQHFELKSIQFHSPSEHRISGKEYPLEIQLHHEDNQGQQAVVVTLAELGQEHQGLGKILIHPAQAINHEYIAPLSFSPEELLPDKHTHYRYMGSLTTPPCSEGVMWIVFNTPIAFSEEQLLTLRSFLRPNNRPLQPLNSRQLKNF